MIDRELQKRAMNPPHKGEANPREKILKLGQHITDVIPHKIGGITSDDPEYWGLASIVTDEMADVALKMERRVYYTVPELWARCSIPDTEEEHEKFQKLLDEMAYVGLIELDYGYHYDHHGRTAPMGERRYALPMFVPGSAEMFNMEEGPEGNKRLREHPELAYFFERMTFIPLAGVTHLLPPGGGGVGMHVIPVEKAIEMENQSLDIEHLSYWLKKYEGHLGVSLCSCRASRAAMGEGCADDEQCWCIGVGEFADYCRESGRGHDITYDEAIRILKKAEENGFVHQVTNIDGENKIFGICNCNINVCNALRTSQLFNTPNLSRSAYTAEVNKENCVACGKCVETCPAGAVRLGQKLCSKDGPVEYPKHELPNSIKWGEEHWDFNYRDTARTNCYDKGTAPCKTACPAHVSVQGYLKKAAKGQYQEALALIKKDNPFPAICGRVCNKRCEDACTRGTIDQAVSIDEVKKFIAQQDLDAETRYIPPVVVASSRLTEWDQKIAIIGAGPAGLSAAYYLATKGYKPTVFEKAAKPGGMMTYGIPSYKLEKDVIEAEIDVLRQLGVDIRCGVEVGKDVTIPQLRQQGYLGFYIAIGCQGGRRPGVPGDTAEGTVMAVDFLHDTAEEQSRRLSGKVLVVGGGNVAVDCARTAVRLGAEKVTMVSLETRREMPATRLEIEEALADGVELRNAWGPKQVLTDEDGKVSGVLFKKCLRTVDPVSHKFHPAYDEQETMELAADHVIFAIGQSIKWGDLLTGTGVEFHQGSYPVADPLTYQTTEEDIFVGGDVYHGPKFVIDAIEDGKCAAESLHRWVHMGADLRIGRNRRDFVMLDKDDIVVDSYDTAGRQEPAVDESIDPRSFRDNRLPLTEEQVKIETARCLGCGASWVDPNKCIGCGVCTTRCDFDAIHLKRDHPEHSTMDKAEDKVKGILPMAGKMLGKTIVRKLGRKD